jgi:hypothetical protein
MNKLATPLNEDGVFVTVGAHDGNGKLAKFSNWGSAVDVLAPGCLVSSYDLDVDGMGNAIDIKPKLVTGTSIAAPLVSFVAAVLSSNPQFAANPGFIKSRLQTASDFDYELYESTYSSGVLDIAKAVAFKQDVIETRVAGQRKLGFGTLSLKHVGEKISCNGETIPFSFIRKFAHGDDSSGNRWTLVFSTDDDSRPSSLSRRLCPTDSFGKIEFAFHDGETSEDLSLMGFDILDYVARQ